MLRDLGLAVEAAMGVTSSIPPGEVARNLYALHIGAGAWALDFSNIAKLLQTTK
jgi:3-hydroxyisobutyrate dehydrogenase